MSSLIFSRGSFLSKLLCFAISFLLFAARTVAQESIEISGLHFAVDEVRVLDEKSARVNLFSSSRIVELSQLAEFVLERYLEDFDRFADFDPDKLQKFFQARAEIGHASSAAAAMHGLLHNSKRDKEYNLTLISQLEESRSEIRKDIFREVLLKFDGDNFIEEYALIVLFLGLSDYEWLRKNSISLIYSHKSALTRIIDQQFSQAALKLDLDRAIKIHDFARLFFGQEDSQVAALRTLLPQLRDIAEGAGAGDFSALLSVLNQRRDARSEGIVGPVITNLLHNHAASELSGNNPHKAISILSRVNFDKRTPETHSLLLQALKEVGPSPNLFIRDINTRESLLRYASRDDDIKKQLIKVLTHQLYFSQQVLNGEGADGLLSSIVLIRPDPDNDNDLLRGEYAHWLVKNGQQTKAHSVLIGVQTGIPFFLRVKIWFSSSPLRGQNPLYILLAITSILALLYIRERRAEALFKPKNKLPPFEEDETPRRLFVNVSSTAWNINPAFQEYQRCLAVLGLSTEASMKEIKAAYRNAVKESHPDSNNANELTASARFIEITSAYERIVDLARAHGFESQNKSPGDKGQ